MKSHHQHAPTNKAITFSVRHLISKCPTFIFHRSAEFLLNQKLRFYICSGELDFLEGRRWVLDIKDAPRTLCIQLINRRLMISAVEDKADLVFKGPIASFIALALKEEDPDSLFFNRKLMISGDTELGLEIKNFIDRMPLETVMDRHSSNLLRYINKAFISADSAQYDRPG